jgi:crotonobetainyl-CoA:carnitine CoA-transferase CaiB-like acyl-CoA transferase
MATGCRRLWKLVNGGKCVVTLDLKRAEDTELLTELLARATCWSNPTGPACSTASASRARGSPRSIRAWVHAALSGYGQTGPWRLRHGHDLNYMAVAGGLAASGPQAVPGFAFPPTADYTRAGCRPRLAVCAALAGRARAAARAPSST